MKTLSFFIVIFITTFSSFSQDFIILKNNKRIDCIITKEDSVTLYFNYINEKGRNISTLVEKDKVLNYHYEYNIIKKNFVEHENKENPQKKDLIVWNPAMLENRLKYQWFFNICFGSNFNIFSSNYPGNGILFNQTTRDGLNVIRLSYFPKIQSSIEYCVKVGWLGKFSGLDLIYGRSYTNGVSYTDQKRILSIVGDNIGLEFKVRINCKNFMLIEPVVGFKIVDYKIKNAEFMEIVNGDNYNVNNDYYRQDWSFPLGFNFIKYFAKNWAFFLEYRYLSGVQTIFQEKNSTDDALGEDHSDKLYNINGGYVDRPSFTMHSFSFGLCLMFF